MDNSMEMENGAIVDGRNETIDSIQEELEIIEDNSEEERAKVQEKERKLSSHDLPEPQDEHEDEEVEEAPVKRKPRDPQKTKMNQILRERFQLENERNIIAQENERLRQEMENLRSINEYSTKAAVTNYETSTLDRLDRAKDRKTRAIESGDVKEQVDADIALSTALNEFERLKTWKENQRMYESEQQQQRQQPEQYAQNQYQPQNAQYQQPQPYTPHIQQWYQENEWFDESSEDHDPDAREFAIHLSNNMDAELYRAGLQNQIYGAQYVQYLDREIQKFRQGGYDDRRRPSANRPPSQQPTQRSQGMTAPRNIVSPVNNSGYKTNGKPNNRNQVRLTSEQIDMAKRMMNIPGVSMSDYAKAAIEIEREDELNARYDSSRRR